MLSHLVLCQLCYMYLFIYSLQQSNLTGSFGDIFEGLDATWKPCTNPKALYNIYLLVTKENQHPHMCSRSPSLSVCPCLFIVNLCKDIEQQRHAVLMRVIGAMCMSRGVYVHSPVPRRCHLPQDGGLPEVPTALRCHPGGWRETDTCTQVGLRDTESHSQVLSFYPATIRDV